MARGLTSAVKTELATGAINPIILLEIGFATPENNWLFAGRVKLRKWIQNAPSVPFLEKEILLFEFDKAVSKKQPLDGKIWRWICYLKWCEIMKIEFM